jgi:DNA polymerase-3 subunit alpha
MMAFLSIEDKSGNADTIVFPRTYQEMKEVLIEGKPMLIAGRINVRDGDKSIILEKAKYIDEEKFGSNFQGVVFRITSKHSADDIKQLKEYIANSQGDVPVKIILNDGEKNITKVLDKTISMDSETKRWLRKF